MKRIGQTVLALVFAAGITTAAIGQGLPPLAKQLDPKQTALILVDFQANFTSPEGTHFPRLKKHFEETKMLERTVQLVQKARTLGVQIVHVSSRSTVHVARPISMSRWETRSASISGCPVDLPRKIGFV